MKLVIYRTFKSEVVATSEVTLRTAEEYIAYLRKFNVQIDMKDAVKDIVVGEQVDLTLPLEMDYSLSC